MSRMRFGIFLPPHHVPVGQNPTYSLQRDVELVQLLDRMGFDEAWFGEHHSCGVEPIGDPILFIRSDEVDQAWAIVAPIQAAFADNQPPIAHYAAGSWGPLEGNRLIEGSGRQWRNP